MYVVIHGLDGIEALVWKNSKLENILLQAIDSGCLLSRGVRPSSASLSTGPPDIQIESIAEGYIVVVVPQLQRGIQLSGYQTKR